MSDAAGVLGSVPVEAGAVLGSVPVEAGAVLGSETVGLVELAGVLQATTAPPREAARAKASRIRFIMSREFLRVRERRGSGARPPGATTTLDGTDRGRTLACLSTRWPLQAPRIRRAVRRRSDPASIQVQRP
jgi:hypothetical protein